MAAQRLLGCELERTIDGSKLRVRIVETEANDQVMFGLQDFSTFILYTECIIAPLSLLNLLKERKLWVNTEMRKDLIS